MAPLALSACTYVKVISVELGIGLDLIKYRCFFMVSFIYLINNKGLVGSIKTHESELNLWSFLLNKHKPLTFPVF